MYCSPDNDIEINPLQSLDAGLLYSVVKTVKVNAKLFAGDTYNKDLGDNNKPVTNIPIEIKRTEIIPGLQGEGEAFNNVAFKERPSADPLMVDYGSSKIAGVTFNHLLRSKQYSIEPIIQQEANTSISYVPKKEKFNFIALDTDPLAGAIDKDFIFNNEFTEETISLPMILDADLPVIAGRLLNSISKKGIQDGGQVTLSGSGVLSVSLPIDAEGYFSFKSELLEGQSIKVTVSAKGYSTVDGEPYNLYTIAKMQKGQKQFSNLDFIPSASITGYVVNEKGEHLPSLYKEQTVDFIQETDMDFWCAYGQSSKNKGSGAVTGAYTSNTNFTGNTKSDCQQNFKTYATPGKETVIVIIPNDLKYFNDTIKVTPKAKGDNNLGKITLITREHRINFKVVGQNGEAIPGAKILLLDKELTMNDKGVRSYNFMNISEKNYWVKIIPPSGSNYIGRQTTFTSNETKNFVEQKFTLKPGGSISGTVKLNGTPLKNAKVYINNGEGAAVTQTITGDGGKYTLSGIKQQSGKINITASGPAQINGTILAESKEVTLSDKKEVVFELKLLEGVIANKLLGYDVIIEKTELVRGQTKISGSLDLNRAGGDFKLFDADTRIGFTDVIIKTGEKDANGLAMAEPIGDIPLDVAEFKARFSAAYNLQLIANENKIIIKKLSSVTGAVEAKAKISDNSFNFPSSYLKFDNTKFYFATKQNNVLTNLLSLFSTAENQQKPTYYFTNSAAGPISFKLMDFDAVSPADQTYFTEGKIRLLPTITATGINTLGKPLQVDLPELKIDQNGVSPLDGNKPIEFNLENWKVSIPKWKLSTDEGGIVADKNGGNVIRTGVLDIPFKKFRLRNDVLLIDETNLKSLKVGGIVDVKLAPDAVATFGLDQKTGNDLKPHYILRMLGNNGAPVGKLQALEGLPQEIEIQAATLVSSGEQYIDFSPNSKNITAFELIDFKPSMIESSEGSFSILGNVDLGIPRLASFYGGFTYSKKQNNIIVEPNFKAINFDIGKGYVQFKSEVSAGNVDKNRKIIKNGSIELYGTVIEPKQLPENIWAKLTKDASGTNIKIINNPVLDYGAGTTMVLSEGLTTVINNDWDYLTFTGTLKKDNKRPPGFDADNPLKFKVFGEILYESGTLAVQQSTPFGEMKMEFDWPKKRIMGSLTFNNLTIGAASATGEAEIAIDKNGFYTFIAADVAFGVPILSPLKAGFLIGKYENLTPDVIARTMQFNHHKIDGCEPINLMGFLLAGRKDLFEPIDFHLDLPPLLPLVSVGLVAECGVDAALFMNFAKPAPAMTLQVGAFGKVSISVASITGTSASGSVGVDLTGKIKYVFGGDFNADFCNGISLDYKVKQSLVVKDIEKSGSISLSAKGGLANSSPYFKLSLTDCKGEKCQTKSK